MHPVPSELLRVQLRFRLSTKLSTPDTFDVGNACVVFLQGEKRENIWDDDKFERRFSAHRKI